MQKWMRQNITMMVIITLLGGYGAGAAIAAVLMSDVSNAKEDIKQLKEQIYSLPEDLASIKATLTATNEDVKIIKNYMLGNK